MSSIESTDLPDGNETLLQQIINVGMKTSTNQSKSSAPETSKKLQSQHQSPKRSQLPTFHTAAKYQHERLKERERHDKQLLINCINIGIEKNVRSDGKNKTSHSQNRHLIESNVNAKSNPKNLETTSVVVSDTISTISASNTAPGVERSLIEGTKQLEPEHRQAQQTNTQMKSISKATHPTDVKSTIPINNGFNTSVNLHKSLTLTNDNELVVSFASLNLSGDANLMEQSNEYPARKLSYMEYSQDSLTNSVNQMDVSNEFLMEYNEDGLVQRIDKHKDPELMLRSVERLTHKLVSTAEYLRTTNASKSIDEDSGTNGKNDSNNTWNEDTCPNDVSFPSLSVTVPMIASMNDDTTISDPPVNGIIEENFAFDIEANNEFEYRSLPKSSSSLTQPDSLDSDTNTLVNTTDTHNSESTINFVIGGEVHHHNLCNGSPSFDSTMTNSTIIALEATKLRTDLLNMQGITNSMTSIDLDNVRPPSAMENLSTCSYLDTPNSPLIARRRKKSLPQGLMARRAINNIPGGSLESINSTCNLDNVKPPSLMDELLDSLISVDSLPSEVADNPDSLTYQFEQASHYETAHSELDDATTVGSCTDLLFDTTSIQSGFSSAESTPKRLESPKRVLTPRQKRQVAKDRYRTYTIAAEQNTEYDSLNGVEQLNAEDNDITNQFESGNFDNESLSDAEEMSSIRALTKKFTFLRDLNAIKSPKSKINVQLESRFQAIQKRTTITNTKLVNNNSSSEHLDTQETVCSDDETAEENEMPKPKPKILRNEDDRNTQLTDDAELKTVRGRKKPAYVSPYKMVNQDTKPIAKANVSNPKADVAPNKSKMETTKQVNNLTSTNKSNTSNASASNVKSSTASKISSIRSKYLQPKVADKIIKKSVQKSSDSLKECQTPPEIKPLQRQGTFTKDEPTCSDVPIVYSEPLSPAKTSKTPTKGTSFISKLKIPLKRSVSYVTSPKTPTATNRFSQPTSPSPSSVGQPYNRSSVGGSTSRSNSSLNSSKAGTPGSQPLSRSSSTLSNTNPKREVSSRIANLWKKTDTSTKRTTVTTTTTAISVKKVNSVCVRKPPTPSSSEPKLIRSTTFDNTPPVKQTKPSTGTSTPQARQTKFSSRSTVANGTKKLSIIGSLVNV